MIQPLAKQIQQLDSLLRRLAPIRRKLIDLKQPERSGQKTGIILEFVRKNPDCSDDEIAKALGVSEQSEGFHALKSSILSRLINGLALIDLKQHGYSDYAAQLYKNNKLVFATKVLAFLGLRDVADAMAARGLRVAEKLELASNSIEFLRTLQHGAVLQGDEPRLASIRKKLDWWTQVLVAEVQIESLSHSHLIRWAHKGAPSKSDIDHVFDASLEAERRFAKLQTFDLGVLHYRLKAIYFQLRDQYAECLAVCKEAERYIESRESHWTGARVAEFALKRLSCCIRIRDRAQGEDAAETCEKVYPADSVNWYVVQENRFLLYCAVLDLEAARRILNRVTGSTPFMSLPVFRRERWLILELYLLYAEGKLDLIQRLNSDITPTFNDFIKWVPTYSQDKAGYNAAVLILHVLFLISKGEWAAVGERVGALESYRVKHLKRANKQADIFVQMLIEVSKSNFSLREVTARTSELHQKLLDTIDSDLANTGVQIFPFDWLWERVRASLK